jgi:hypothetical protein
MLFRQAEKCYRLVCMHTVNSMPCSPRMIAAPPHQKYSLWCARLTEIGIFDYTNANFTGHGGNFATADSWVFYLPQPNFLCLRSCWRRIQSGLQCPPTKILLGIAAYAIFASNLAVSPNMSSIRFLMCLKL